MNVVIFADGSARVGAGHQVRMSTLARQLAAAGHGCLLVCVDLPGSSHEWAWGGLPQRVVRDEAGLLALVTARGPDAVIVDSYAVLPDTLSALGRRAALVVFDDVPGRDLSAASLVVNASPDASAADYPPGARVASGLEFALVRPEFSARRGVDAEGPTLVMLGATDARGLLPAVLDHLLDSTGRHLAVVTGDLGAAPREHERIEWHHGLPAGAVARLMRSSSGAVLTASSVCLEAACVGLPFVALEVAANQARLAAALRRAGVVVLAPERVGDLADALVRARVPADLPVDDQGAARVVAAIEHLLAGAG
jgi:spore coat polysaccharide biosynthesis predicted glycosyltransferase SpsG